MNLPNKLSVSRIILTFIFMFFLFSSGLLAKYMAFIVFTLAALTDFYDGRIARKMNIVTDFGKLIDPIADKILVLAAFLAFVEMKIIPAWTVVLIIARELIITSLRLLAISKKTYLAAAIGGKHKTLFQIIVIFIILIFLIVKETAVKFFTFWNSGVEYWARWGILILMLITVTLTLVSGVTYLWKNRNLIV